MNIKFGEKLSIAAPYSKVYAFAIDPKSISECIPDSQDFKQTGADNFEINVKIGIAFVQGTFSIKCSISRLDGSRLEYTIDGKGIGSSVNILLSVEMNRNRDLSTGVEWKADTTISGVASGVSEGIIRKVSEDKIKEIISNVREKIE